jgi:hypothetical protein
VFRERQTSCHNRHDSNPCYRETTDKKGKGHGHKLYNDCHFSSPDFYNDLTEQKINCCSAVRLNSKGMPTNFRSKTLKLKWGDIGVRTSGDMTALI